MTIIKIIFLVACAVLAYVYMGEITWVPFVLLATFIFIVNFFPPKTNNPNRNSEAQVKPVQIGVLGHYDVEGDLCYGLFMLLEGKNTFVDIKEDHLVIQREALARSLIENCHILEKSLAEFRSRNPSFKDNSISSLGTFSKDLNRIEVFWDSGAYTVTKGFEFVDDDV